MRIDALERPRRQRCLVQGCSGDVWEVVDVELPPVDTVEVGAPLVFAVGACRSHTRSLRRRAQAMREAHRDLVAAMQSLDVAVRQQSALRADLGVVQARALRAEADLAEAERTVGYRRQRSLERLNPEIPARRPRVLTGEAAVPAAAAREA